MHDFSWQQFALGEVREQGVIIRTHTRTNRVAATAAVLEGLPGKDLDHFVSGTAEPQLQLFSESRGILEDHPACRREQLRGRSWLRPPGALIKPAVHVAGIDHFVLLNGRARSLARAA